MTSQNMVLLGHVSVFENSCSILTSLFGTNSFGLEPALIREINMAICETSESGNTRVTKLFTN